MIHAQIRVTGQVQGVGFRPFVYKLAHELGLAGWVRNDGGGVEIAVEGEHSQVMSLIERLQHEPPVLARVEHVTHEFAHATRGLFGFNIAPSTTGKVRTGITPDTGICSECLAELFDPGNRRYLHAFINCIHCGPRYTLTARLPYDRVNTSMAKFVLCPQCQLEYDTPSTRRFHAQANACPKCGPQLSLFDAEWNPLAGNNPVASAAELIRAGKVIALKGLGGFHLVCDARNASAVARLRAGKQREEKPFAVMVLNSDSAKYYAEINSNPSQSPFVRGEADSALPLTKGSWRGLERCESEVALLESGARPIVVLRQTEHCAAELQGIAPGLSSIGLMLPYTPLHYLLLHELLGRPQGRDWLRQATPLALVMTSANPGGQPLVKNDVEARASLCGLADAFLTHDREILQRCDDSLVKWQNTKPVFIRRSRGYTPRRILLPYSGPSILACGAWLKNTVCLTRGNEAFVSQHIGDLGHAAARQMLHDTVAHLIAILDVKPEGVAHDFHPDFYSTRFAQTYAGQHHVPVYAVMHHHAHIEAICAERGGCEAVIGVALDGVGLGEDGSAWGGELLRVAGTQCARLGHLALLRLPGGDHAAHQPWRMAASVLFELNRGDEIAKRFARQSAAATIHSLLQRKLNCPPTSSMGRYFDAAAGLLGVSEVLGYEGQAAMQLQTLAEQYGQCAAMPGGYTISPESVLSFLPLFAVLADEQNVGRGAALFHATLVAGLGDWVQDTSRVTGITTVVLGGGCFLNDVMTNALTDSLASRGFRVLTAQQLPPNDGAISLGQASVALQRILQGV